MPTENGSVARFNAAKLAGGFYRDWVDGGIHYANQSLINDTLEHELIHAAWIDAQRRRWNMSGPLFGPKLIQSKLNRLTADPAQTIKTFTNWQNATAGEKAVAWTRLSGATQYLVTGLGFLAVNQGLLSALGLRKKEDQINWTDPTKSDFLAFKLGGIEGYVPGLHTEIRTLAKILATSFMTRKQLRGESRQSELSSIGGQYVMGKLTPAIQRGVEIGYQQNWQGRPVPWSNDQGTAKEPRLSWGEYLGSIGPSR